jgi:hypothetical protein
VAWNRKPLFISNTATHGLAKAAVKQDIDSTCVGEISSCISGIVLAELFACVDWFFECKRYEFLIQKKKKCHTFYNTIQNLKILTLMY